MKKYHITELGVVSGGTYSFASGVNGRGDAVGWGDAVPGLGQKSAEHALYWDGHTGLMTDLHLTALAVFGAAASRALDINELGQVVGWVQVADGQQLGFVWSKSLGVQLLPPLAYAGPGTYFMTPNAINDFGWVVGVSSKKVIPSSLPDIEGHAFLWTQTTIVDLNPAGSGFSIAEDINDWFQVVGGAALFSDKAQPSAFYWPPFTDLNPNGTEPSAAVAIGDQEVIVGDMGSPGGDRATVFLPSLGINFSLFGLKADSLDISDQSQVVGQAQFGAGSPSHAFLLDGTLADLNTRIDDSVNWELLSATGISKDGNFIVGDGNHNGNTRGFLLSPIPPPEFHPALVSYPVDKVLWLLRHWFDPGPGVEPARVGTPSEQMAAAFVIGKLADSFSEGHARERIRKEAAEAIAFLVQRGRQA